MVASLPGVSIFNLYFLHLFYLILFCVMSSWVVLGTGRCRSVGGRAGLGQPGRGARATQQPVRCGGHVDGGRVGGGFLESSPVPAALINVAFIAIFLCFFHFLFVCVYFMFIF